MDYGQRHLVLRAWLMFVPGDHPNLRATCSQYRAKTLNAAGSRSSICRSSETDFLSASRWVLPDWERSPSSDGSGASQGNNTTKSAWKCQGTTSLGPVSILAKMSVCERDTIIELVSVHPGKKPRPRQRHTPSRPGPVSRNCETGKSLSRYEIQRGSSEGG